MLNLGANYEYLVQGVVIITAAAVYTVAGRRRRAAETVTTVSGTADVAQKDPAEPATRVGRWPCSPCGAHRADGAAVSRTMNPACSRTTRVSGGARLSPRMR